MHVGPLGIAGQIIPLVGVDEHDVVVTHGGADVVALHDGDHLAHQIHGQLVVGSDLGDCGCRGAVVLGIAGVDVSLGQNVVADQRVLGLGGLVCLCLAGHVHQIVNGGTEGNVGEHDVVTVLLDGAGHELQGDLAGIGGLTLGQLGVLGGDAHLLGETGGAAAVGGHVDGTEVLVEHQSFLVDLHELGVVGLLECAVQLTRGGGHHVGLGVAGNHGSSEELQVDHDSLNGEAVELGFHFFSILRRKGCFY